MSESFWNKHLITTIKLNRILLMLFIAILIILIIIFLIHTTKVELIQRLEKGDVDGALRLLHMFD